MFGLHPYVTPWELQMLKLGRLEPGPRLPQHRIGDIVEAGLLDWMVDEFGMTIKRRQRRVYQGRAPLAANLDALETRELAPIDAKRVDYGNALFDQYGDDGTDEIPAYVTIQLHVQMMCVGHGSRHAYCVAMLGHSRIAVYRVERDDALCHLIETTVREWWQRHIVEEQPVPFVPTPAYDIVKRLRHREDGAIVQVDGELLSDLKRLTALKGQLDKSINEHKARVCIALDGARQGVADNGYRVEIKEVHRAGYTVGDTSYERLQVKEPQSERATKRIGSDGRSAGHPSISRTDETRVGVGSVEAHDAGSDCAGVSDILPAGSEVAGMHDALVAVVPDELHGNGIGT